VEPLKTALNDDDPYVRKTAVLSIPKVYEIAPNDAESNNLVHLLEVLVNKESNALVMANAIASLEEIGVLTGKNHIKMDSQLLGRILVAINECMEWAQVFILDFLSKYTPKDEKEAEMYFLIESGLSIESSLVSAISIPQLYLALSDLLSVI
jgi:AP-1 complex subunit beta-1